MAGFMSAGGSGKIVKVDLGTIGCWNGGGSINVKSKLPDLYDKLTSDNFFIEPDQSRVLAGGTIDWSGDKYWSFSKSYNPSTGLLSMSMMGQTLQRGHLHGGLSSGHAYAVYVK